MRISNNSNGRVLFPLINTSKMSVHMLKYEARIYHTKKVVLLRKKRKTSKKIGQGQIVWKRRKKKFHHINSHIIKLIQIG